MKKYFHVVYSYVTFTRVIPFLNELKKSRFRFYYDDGLNKINNDVLDNVIKNSSFVILFINENYKNDLNIIKNLEYINKYNKDIILILLGDVYHDINYKYEFKYDKLFDLYYEVKKLNILDETFNYDDFNNDILYEIDLNNGNELYFKGLDLYYLGKYEEAYKYLKKASDLNNASATYLLSWCYRTNKGIETDYDIADELLYKAFEMGANDATFAYAKSLTRWFNKKCNYAEALKIYTDLAMNGNLEAYYILGESYLRGNFTVKDYNLAFTWFKRGANLGHSLCMYKLSECYRYEIGVNQDDKEYIKWLKKSAHSGCDLACYELSFSYLYGYGVDIDKELAFHYCLMAANMGNDNAMFKLGNYFYSLGVGVKQDDFLMRKWIWDAAVASNEDARIVCDYPGGSTENILKRYEEYVFLKKSVED